MHKYKVGQRVHFRALDRSNAVSIATYAVTRQLPGTDDEPAYLIKSEGETHERSARESQLS
jgi:hypothetical protein